MRQEQFEIGDLVRIRTDIIPSDDFTFIGIVLKVEHWDADLMDILVHWSDGKCFWCTAEALEKLF